MPGRALDLSLGWRLDANGHLTDAAVHSSGARRFYLGSLGRTVYAVGEQGTVAWRARTPGPVYALLPMLDGGLVVGDDAGSVILLDAAGRQVWRSELGTRVTALATAAAEAGAVIAGGWDERVTWLGPSGAVRWQADTVGAVTALAVFHTPTELVVAATLHGQVVAYDTTGRAMWQRDMGAPVAALETVATDGGALLLASLQDGRLQAIDPGGSIAWRAALGDGAPVWQAARMGPSDAWSIVAGTTQPEPSLMHLSTGGAIDWRVSMPAQVNAVLVHELDGDGVPEIIAGLSSGEVIVFDATGKKRASVHAGLPVWHLTPGDEGSLLVAADVVAWQVVARPGPAGGAWLRAPALAPAAADTGQNERRATVPVHTTQEATDTASEATLLFLGDVSPGRSMEAHLLRYGPAYPWVGLRGLPGETAGSTGTLLVVNLEGVLTTRGEALPKTYVIRAHPVWGEALAAGGVGLASLANNHALDYGEEGLEDTLDTLDALGIAAVGAGAAGSGGARQPARFTLNGVRVAVLAYAAARWDGSEDVPHTDRIAWANPGEVAADVAAIHNQVDLVVILLHAGTEYAGTPSADQVAVAHAAIDAGAKLVVGHHPHVTQSIERYKDGLIVYSLGNAIFDIPRQAAMRGHLLRVQIEREGLRTAELWPFWIDEGIQPRLLDDGGGEAGSPLDVRVEPIYP